MRHFYNHHASVNTELNHDGESISQHWSPRNLELPISLCTTEFGICIKTRSMALVCALYHKRNTNICSYQTILSLLP